MLILREQKYCMYLPTNIRTNSRAKAETHMDFCSFAISIDGAYSKYSICFPVTHAYLCNYFKIL